MRSFCCIERSRSNNVHCIERGRPTTDTALNAGNLTHVQLHTLLHRLQLGGANILSASKSTQRKHESIKLQSANVYERCLCAPFIGTAYLNPNCHSQLSPGLDHCKSQTRHRINKSTLTFGDRFVCDLIFPHFQDFPVELVWIRNHKKAAQDPRIEISELLFT